VFSPYKFHFRKHISVISSERKPWHISRNISPQEINNHIKDVSMFKKNRRRGFQDGDHRKEIESVLRKVKSWRDAGDTHRRKNH
jgi:hypothetical protein